MRVCQPAVVFRRGDITLPISGIVGHVLASGDDNLMTGVKPGTVVIATGMNNSRQEKFKQFVLPRSSARADMQVVYRV
jgi:hypothetical protein